MLQVCVRKFDVTGTAQKKFFWSKRPLNGKGSPKTNLPGIDKQVDPTELNETLILVSWMSINLKGWCGSLFRRPTSRLQRAVCPPVDAPSTRLGALVLYRPAISAITPVVEAWSWLDAMGRFSEAGPGRRNAGPCAQILRGPYPSWRKIK